MIFTSFASVTSKKLVDLCKGIIYVIRMHFLPKLKKLDIKQVTYTVNQFKTGKTYKLKSLGKTLTSSLLTINYSTYIYKYQGINL